MWHVPRKSRVHSPSSGGWDAPGGAVMMWMEHILVQNPNPTQCPLNYWDGRDCQEVPAGAIGATSLSRLSPVSVQLLNCVRFFATWNLLKLTSIESMMPSNHLILCHPLLLLLSIFPSFRVFSNESVLRIRWPKYWSFSFSISPSNEYSDWSPLGWTGWISLQSKGLSRVFSNTTVQKHQFFGAQLSL